MKQIECVITEIGVKEMYSGPSVLAATKNNGLAINFKKDGYEERFFYPDYFGDFSEKIDFLNEKTNNNLQTLIGEKIIVNIDDKLYPEAISLFGREFIFGIRCHLKKVEIEKFN